MKAVWYEKTGAAEVLCFGEMEMPSPAAGEVLVRVCASGVNPSDVKIRAGARGAMAFCDRFLIPMAPASLKRWARASPLHAWGAGVALERRHWSGAWHLCGIYRRAGKNKPSPCTRKLNFVSGACFGVPLMTAAYGVLGDGAVDGQLFW